jgi:pilus assembly protein FimV
MSRYVQNLLWLPAILSGSAHALGLGELHVTSALNEPLAAQIDIIGATPEELADLRAAIANRDTFQRYGADRPAFLATANFKVGKDKAGRPVLMVRSSDAFTEPLVSLLVDLRWSSGELVREYTLLLDPAISASSASRMPEGSLDAARAEPARLDSPRVMRSDTASLPPVPGPRGTSPDSEPYVVARRDTLGAIARRRGTKTESELLKTMVAIFHANPSAFMGNINRLRVGATLTIPSDAIIAAIPERAASLEVHAQMLAWHTPAGALVALAQTGAAPAPLAVANGSKVSDFDRIKQLADRIEALQQGLADLQRQQDQRTGTAPASTRVAAPSPSAAAPASAAAAAAPSPWVTPVPSASTAPPPVAAKNTEAPRPAPALADAAPATVSHGGLLAGACVLLGAGIALAYRRIRRRADEETDDVTGAEFGDRDNDSKPFSIQPEYDSPAPAAIQPVNRLPARAPSLVDDDAGIETILEGDTAHSRVVPTGADDEDSTGETTVTVAITSLPSYDPTLELPRQNDLEDTSPIDFDNSETHVNIPSGLHDQVKFVERRTNVIDVLRSAIEREPDRMDLRIKLMELYHATAATNRQGFIDAVRKLAEQPNYQATTDWDRIVAMGRQIAPEDPLFALDPTVQHEKIDDKFLNCA